MRPQLQDRGGALAGPWVMRPQLLLPLEVLSRLVYLLQAEEVQEAPETAK